MKRFFKWLGIVLLVLVGIFVVGGFLIPSKWEVSESIKISAPTEAIHKYVSNLRTWPEWTPWGKKQDPTLEFTYEGPESGVGAKESWTSENMGSGWLLIKESDVESGIKYELFIDMGSMQSTLNSDIVYKPQNGETEVIWTDRGDSGFNLVKRWMSLMIQSMLGGELREALTNLKTLAEKPS